jgi:hypothetical protein
VHGKGAAKKFERYPALNWKRIFRKGPGSPSYFSPAFSGSFDNPASDLFTGDHGKSIRLVKDVRSGPGWRAGKTGNSSSYQCTCSLEHCCSRDHFQPIREPLPDRSCTSGFINQPAIFFAFLQRNFLLSHVCQQPVYAILHLYKVFPMEQKMLLVP